MKKSIIAALLTAVLSITSLSVAADPKSDAEGYVNDSLKTLNNFINDPDMGWFRNHVKKAKGILIIPRLLKAGFLVGGSGGNGVLLKHDSKASHWSYSAIDQWSYPAFYSMGSVSVGFQIGGEAAEVVLLIMSDKGMDAFFAAKAQLGADMSVAAGPVGAGAKVATADVFQFARSKGIYAGLNLEGSVINPRDKFNHAYYGKDVTPLNILVQGEARNPQAYNLRAKLASIR